MDIILSYIFDDKFKMGTEGPEIGNKEDEKGGELCQKRTALVAPESSRQLETFYIALQQAQLRLEALLAAGASGTLETVKNTQEILAKQTFIDKLSEDLPRFSSLLKNFNEGIAASLDNLHEFCMGAFLEMTNSPTLSDEGEILIDVNEKNGVRILRPDGHEMLVRQAVAAQIERWAVFRANGLVETLEPKPDKILCVGGGTLIECVMLRQRFPEAEIVAVEPGFISHKSRKIAQLHGIALRAGDLASIDAQEKFDLITLHFVLEHAAEEATNIVREALERLALNGLISVAIPNFDAFHRELETTNGLGKRDPGTRTSEHDRYRGHKIIFQKLQILEHVKEAQDSHGTTLPVHVQTILPRPLSFAAICSISEQKKLLDLELCGHIPCMEEQGSVTCITIGGKAGQRPITVNKDGRTAAMFRELISKYCAAHPSARVRSLMNSLRVG